MPRLESRATISSLKATKTAHRMANEILNPQIILPPPKQTDWEPTLEDRISRGDVPATKMAPPVRELDRQPLVFPWVIAIGVVGLAVLIVWSALYYVWLHL